MQKHIENPDEFEATMEANEEIPITSGNIMMRLSTDVEIHL